MRELKSQSWFVQDSVPYRGSQIDISSTTSAFCDHPHEFFGARTFERNVGEFEVVESRFEPDSRLPPHAHPCDVLIFMAHGRRRDFVGSRSVECESGTVMLHPGNLPHHNRFCSSGDSVVINLKLPTKFLEDRAGYQPANELSYLMPGQSRSLAARFELEIRLADDLSEWTMTELLVEYSDAVHGYSERNSVFSRSKWFRQLLEHLQATSAEPFSLANLAKEMRRNPAHLSRTFRRWSGCTIGTWLRHLRIAQACNMLAQTDRSIADVAVTAGFSDQSHLSRCMRSILGVAPGKYRNTIRASR